MPSEYQYEEECDMIDDHFKKQIILDTLLGTEDNPQEVKNSDDHNKSNPFCSDSPVESKFKKKVRKWAFNNGLTVGISC